MSRWIAKRAYSIELVSIDDYSKLDSKQKLVYDLVRDIAERNHIDMPEV